LKRISLVQVGVGLIGGTTIGQIVEHRARWRDELGVEIGVAALVSRDGAIVAEDPHGFSDRVLHSVLGARQSGLSLAKIASNKQLQLIDSQVAIDEVAAMGRFIVVDSATGDATAAISARALEHGGGVVYSNKAPLSLPAGDPAGDAIWANAGSNGTVRYETSCGAGLPIISTLRSLLDTGDEVIEITGTVSGTFGAILSDVAVGKPFSGAVRSARAFGYTEPDPRDDLSGLDVARKALILARTLGRRVNLDGIEIESLVPEALRELEVPEYLDRVVEQDDDMAQRASDANAEGKTLKYVAEVRPHGRISVGLRPVATNAVLGALQGPENIVTFRTKRYDDYPMNITGPGAGAAVTSAGVITDILALATGPIGARS
jgi:homoserine dehydrogenase